MFAKFMMKRKKTAQIYLWFRAWWIKYQDRKTSSQYFKAREMATQAINHRIELGLDPKPYDPLEDTTTVNIGRYDMRVPRYGRPQSR